MGTKSGAYQDVYIKREDEMVSLKNDVTDFCEKYIKPVHPQNWDWYHNQFLGAGQYEGNTWRPTSAILKMEKKGPLRTSIRP